MTNNTPSSSSGDKGKRKAADYDTPFTSFNGSPTGEEEANALLEANRVEAARDQGDPDFKATSRKRKRKQKAGPATRADGSAKRQRTVHKRYDKCGKATQEERARCIERIEGHWRTPFQEWLPFAYLPRDRSSPSPFSRTGADAQAFLNPRHWTTSILLKLTHLAAITKGNPGRAYRMLEVAVSRLDRPEKIQEILDSDVRNAIIRCEQETLSDTQMASATASQAPRLSSTTNESYQPPATPAIGKTDNEPLEEVLPGAQVRPVRSPTFEGVRIKEEPGNTNTTNVATADADSSDADDDSEKIRRIQLQRKLESHKAKEVELALEEFEARKRRKDRLKRQGSRPEDSILL